MKTENNQLQKLEAPTPLVLLQQAVEKGVDLQQLEKLMDMQERWEKKEAKKTFLDALSRFQTMVPVLKKTKTAKITPRDGKQAFSYKYADLGSITRSIAKSLQECGLSYRWDFEEKNGLLKVNCHVSHRDGHTETTSMEAGKDASGAKNDIQQKGSTQTYLQRYTLIGALGLSTADEDNDGRNGEPTSNYTQLTEEEILQQWTDLLSQCKSRVEVTALYHKNRKVVDANEKIKQVFKARQDQLPQTQKKTPVML